MKGIMYKQVNDRDMGIFVLHLSFLIQILIKDVNLVTEANARGNLIYIAQKWNKHILESLQKPCL